MNTRLTIAFVLTVMMPLYASQTTQDPDLLLFGFAGYVILTGYLVATGYSQIRQDRNR
jgi:hypothetical protein